jgi:hypothetical protein
VEGRLRRGQWRGPEEEGLHCVEPVGGPKKKRGYMVCTSDYVATNTRKSRLQRTQRTQVRPNPRKWPLCVSFGIWPCMHSRLPHSTQYAPRNLRRELEKKQVLPAVSVTASSAKSA